MSQAAAVLSPPAWLSLSRLIYSRKSSSSSEAKSSSALDLPPKVGANDDGIWRRLVVIPFNAKITGKSDIKNYADYLFEHAGPAIMSWIIEGAKRAIDKNFHTTLLGSWELAAFM